MPKSEGWPAIESQDTLKGRQLGWLVLCAMGGVGLDWYCAFRWFSGRYSLFSEPVLRRMGLIVVLCAALALLAVRLIPRARLRDAGAVFFVASMALSRFMLSRWA
jgi:hypothetical protein